MKRKNDIFLKGVIEESFPDMLRFFFPEAEKTFDIERGFVFIDKELPEFFPDIEKREGTGEMDFLVMAYLLNGRESWILIHIDMQDEIKTDFAQRMFTNYYYQISERFNVPVTALTILTGKKQIDNQAIYSRTFMGTEIHYKYNSFHIMDHSEDELLKMNNPFALVILAAQKVQLSKKISKEEMGEQRLAIARTLITSGLYDQEQTIKFLGFLKEYIYIDSTEINNNFNWQIDLLTGKTNTMGIFEIIADRAMEKGIKKGRLKGKIEFVRYLLQQTNNSVPEIAAIASVTEDFVEKLRKDSKKEIIYED